MHLIPTELNQRLADLVRNRVAAAGSLIAGRVYFWRFVGLGLIAFGIGASAGVAFYGYSYVSRNSDNITSLSAMFSKSLSEVRLRANAEGTVQLEPREIALAQGQAIALDPNSRLYLDPAARVLADGEITVQGPSVSLPQVVHSQSPSSIPTIVNFTVFKSVPFDKGTVQTGWVFLTSAQRSPTHQYCYYTEASDTPGRNVMLDIGADEKFEPPKTLPNDFDLVAAFSKCVWFKREES
jgi:hypothetical protein